jgi:hypothetical protein
MSLKDDLLATRKIIEEKTDTGVKVFLRRMLISERDAWATVIDGDRKSSNPAKLMLSLCVCDEKGKLLFSGPDEVNIDATILDELALKCLELNLLSKAAQEAREKKAQAPTGSRTS